MDNRVALTVLSPESHQIHAQETLAGQMQVTSAQILDVIQSAVPLILTSFPRPRVIPHMNARLCECAAAAHRIVTHGAAEK